MPLLSLPSDVCEAGAKRECDINLAVLRGAISTLLASPSDESLELACDELDFEELDLEELDFEELDLEELESGVLDRLDCDSLDTAMLDADELGGLGTELTSELDEALDTELDAILGTELDAMLDIGLDAVLDTELEIGATGSLEKEELLEELTSEPVQPLKNVPTTRAAITLLGARIFGGARGKRVFSIRFSLCMLSVNKTLSCLEFITTLHASI